MSRLLHWAVQHSDPERLKEVMRKYKDNNLTLKDVYGQEVWDALFTDEASVMKTLIRQIADFRNTSVEDAVLDDSLERLEEFIEQVDNAGNLHRMGGLWPLLALAVEPARPPATRARALWTLGVAAQNNPPVQEDILSLDGLRTLAAQLPRCNGSHAGSASEPASGAEAPLDAQYCGKLLFAISAIVKNSATIQEQASALGIFDWLLSAGAAHPALPVAKKALGLLETVLAQNAEVGFVKSLPLEQEGLAEVLLAHVRGETGAEESNSDTVEKALRLIVRLLGVRPMLFPATFQARLAAAAAEARQRCERSFGTGEEICETLQSLANTSDFILTARDVADGDL